MLVFEGKVAVVLLAHVPRAIEPEKEAALAAFMSEAARLEGKHVTGFEHSVPIAEPEHETSVTEVTEVPPHEGLRLPKEATLVEHGATVSQVQLRASVSREMAKTNAVVMCLGWLGRHSQRHYDS
jgi:hypothetical protein